MYSPISKILTDYKNGKIDHWDAHDKILRLSYTTKPLKLKRYENTNARID